MKLTFTKRDGKYDDLVIERSDGARETVQNPKQGIIPHDMVHYAIESVLARRGFLSLVAGGEALAFATAGGEAEESVERLVEAFQAEMWGGRVPEAELRHAYELGCEARGHPALPVTDEDIAGIRERLDELTAAWAEVPVDGSMTLDFDGH
jgi:hypothetical protein